MDLLLFDLPLSQAGDLGLLFSLYCVDFAFALGSSPLGVHLRLNDLVLDPSDLLEVFSLQFVYICCDFALLTLVVHPGLSLAALDLFDLLLQLPLPLLDNHSSFGILPSLLFEFLLPANDLVFASLELSFVGGTDFRQKLVDVAT